MVDVDGYIAKSGVDIVFWREHIVPSVLAIKGANCETCGSSENVDVHHTRYDLQTIHTLMVLCRSCHKKWHAINGSAKELFERYGTVLQDSYVNTSKEGQ